MLDLKYLRYHLTEATQRLTMRGFQLDSTRFLALDAERKSLQETIQQLQQRANEIAKQLGKPMPLPESEGIVHKESLLTESRALKQTLQEKLKAFQQMKETWETFLLTIPNLPDASTPIGQSSEDNQCVRTWGDIPSFDFTPQDHTRIASGPRHAMDFESAASMTGSRFVVLRGMLARLERALTQWMLDVHTEEHGYEEVAVPYLVNQNSLEGTGQLPLFESDLFKLSAANDWYLIPTGEVPLTNLGKNCILEKSALPLQYVAATPCFRSEAGSYGKDVKGMIRQHQFNKVELVQFVTEAQALSSLEKLTQCAEVILQRLKLPYRVMALCAGDLGFAAAKTYDLEVWLPEQSTFREISSCSYMGDFQARRLKARFRDPQTKQTYWMHTLNGSGLAVGRTLVAVLENYQQPDGSVRIPNVLRSYMGGVSVIPPL